MRRLMFFLTLLCVIGVSAQAATVAYWRFEEGPEGAQVPKPAPTGYNWYPSVPDSSGSGNELSVWDEGGAGFIFRSEVPYSIVPVTGETNNFSVKNSGGGPAAFTDSTDPISSMTPAEFTIEATFKLENGGYKTIVGRDARNINTAGIGSNLDNAALYFQTVPNNGLAIKFVDVSGYFYTAIAPANSYIGFDWGTDPEGTTGVWYTMAGVSDGTWLRLYLYNHNEPENGYVLIAETNMDVQNPGSPDRSLANGDGGVEGTNDWTAGDFSVGRGLWAGGHGDRAYGYIDEVRISDSALSPGAFLCGNGISNDSPANNAILIPVALDAPENDLVFTIIDPNIVEADVYLSANDPNADDVIVMGLAIGPDGHEPITTTITLETELGSDLLFDTNYYWKVVGYEPNSVSGLNDIPVVGQVTAFTTAPQTPVITVHPDPFSAVDAGDSLVLTANGLNGNFQWYKDGSPIFDGADYAGTTTNALTINDVQLADEGYYTMKVINTPLEDESMPARVMITRLTSYYDFETTSVVDGNTVFVDSIGGFPAVLMQDAASAGLPTIDDANQLALSMGNYLVLDNADHATDPNGQFLQIYPGVVDYEDITVTAWLHMNSYLGWSRLFDFGINGDTTMFFTPDNGSGSAFFTIRKQGVDGDSIGTQWLSTGQWYHVAITLTGNNGRLYLNGERVGGINTGMTVNPIDLGATINYIGKSFYPDPEFDGFIDELKIYNYALSTNDVAQQYLDIVGGSVCDVDGLDDMTYDLNDDCKIDLADFALVANDWLNDNRIYD